MTLQEQLVAARKRLFPIAAHAAAELKISRAALRFFESGQRIPNEARLLQMAKLYELGDLQTMQLVALLPKKKDAPATPQSTSRLVGRITADILDLLRTGKRLGPAEIHKGIEDIVNTRLQEWQALPGKEAPDGLP